MTAMEAATEVATQASGEDVAQALRRVEAVLQRRPEFGLHDDAPATSRWRSGTQVVASHANGTQIMSDMPNEFGGGGAHGGGYFACSARTHRPYTCFFAAQGFRVFAPNYRLAPEHPFPAAIDDAQRVYLSLVEALGSAGSLVVTGDSAGGGLVLALMQRVREADQPLPAAIALFSPWTDLATTGPSAIENEASCSMFVSEAIRRGAAGYLDGADALHPHASPLYADMRSPR